MNSSSTTQLRRELWKELETNLSEDLTIASQFLALLKQERTALEQRDYQRFTEITEQKPTLLITLEKHSKARQPLLQQLGADDEASTLNMALQQAPEAARLWQALSEQWEQCQHLNAVNERVAKRTQLVVTELLDILRGQNGQTKLYNQRGGTQSAGSGRPISSA